MMLSSLRTTLSRVAVLVALPALVCQSALTQLHAVDEAASLHHAAARTSVAADPVLGSVPAPSAPAHERGTCPLCLARAESHATDVATRTSLAIVLDDATVTPLASRRPPARPACRTPTPRGPPATV
jgi:hypothetical protein